MLPRIFFDGDAGECSQWLPWARRKHAALAKSYGGMRWWAWRREIDGVRIILERQGLVDRIWIKAGGLVGYEFAAAFRNTREEWWLTRLNDWRLTVVVPGSGGAGGVTLVGKNSEGRDIDLDHDTYAEQDSAFMYGGLWYEANTAGRFMAAVLIDWFQIPLPESNEQAAQWAATGYGGCKLMTSSVAHRRRHQDKSWTTNTLGLVDTPYVGPSTKHVIGANKAQSAVIPLMMGHVTPPAGTSVGSASLVGSAAVQNEFIITGSHRADDYKFSLYDETNELGYDLTLASYKPAWVTGDIWTRWYWRGDGRRCIAVQYGASDTSRGPLDSGIHELEWDLVTGNPTPTIYVFNNFVSYNLAGTKPIAIDYDLFDQRKRNVIVMESWLSPYYTGYDSQRDAETSMRALLVYASFCTVNDAGVISAPYRRIPVYHSPWCYGDWEETGIFDEFGKQVSGVGTIVTGQNEAWLTAWGYNTLWARIAATDARANAIALHYLCIRPGEPSGLQESGKLWMIWGEKREQSWVHDDTGAEFIPEIDPIDQLETTPTGYVRLVPGHPLWIDTTIFNGSLTSDFIELYLIYAAIEPYYADFIDSATGGPQQAHVEFQHNGFRINPKKHFALYVDMPREFAYDGYVERSEAAKKFMVFDHIERFRLDADGNPDPIVSTHYDVYNAARGTNYQHADRQVPHMCAQGIWVE